MNLASKVEVCQILDLIKNMTTFGKQTCSGFDQVLCVFTNELTNHKGSVCPGWHTAERRGGARLGLKEPPRFDPGRKQPPLLLQANRKQLPDYFFGSNTQKIEC